jgi:hypothetical protein
MRATSSEGRRFRSLSRSVTLGYSDQEAPMPDAEPTRSDPNRETGALGPESSHRTTLTFGPDFVSNTQDHTGTDGDRTTDQPTPSADPTPATALPVIPGYDVEAEIAHGGMGVVYRARHRQLNRLTAVAELKRAPRCSA